jgi:hypothetical protein
MACGPLGAASVANPSGLREHPWPCKVGLHVVGVVVVDLLFSQFHPKGDRPLVLKCVCASLPSRKRHQGHRRRDRCFRSKPAITRNGETRSYYFRDFKPVAFRRGSPRASRIAPGVGEQDRTDAVQQSHSRICIHPSSDNPLKIRAIAFSSSASFVAKDSRIELGAPKAVPVTVATPWLSNNQSHNSSTVLTR